MREIRDAYEYGRSDGYAEGADDARWAPADVPGKVAHFPDLLRHARDWTQVAATFRSDVEAARRYRASQVGFCRGYRDATGIGGAS